ncbi:Regulator of V-ATPase in vacuolar membrane protein 1 [Exophiala dermatitidis]
MRAILPGQPQSKRQALSTAYWDGLRLVAYISGNAAVILSGPQTILQTIYVDTVDELIAVTLEETTGRIALCDDRHVYVYRPVGRDEGVLRWVLYHELHNHNDLVVTSLSWGTSEELLLGGSRLVLWFIPDTVEPAISWDQTLAYPTALACLSPDSSLVASVGQHDRLVKIWRRLSYDAKFDVSYLPHPAAVTNLHWRKPWHLEQNLDNLLYTFCSDNRIRAWTSFDPHALSIFQQVATIDMNASIQPRRLSVTSMSTRRYAFIVDSRDFCIATEKAVQGANPKVTDHALEHLIEIANRSPEICVVLDGLGHMSIWGIENAGYKNRIPPSVFHISHVDGMNVLVPQLSDPLKDYVQFCIFAGGVTRSSLSILMHSFAGDIDWYDSQITYLFDTAIRHDRTRLISTLAGHGSPIQRVVRNVGGTVVLSATEECQASVWQHDLGHSTAPILRRCSFAVDNDIKDAVILSRGRYAAILTTDGLELWDIREAKALRLGTRSFGDNRVPECITQSRVGRERALTSRVIVGYHQDNSAEAWELLLPAKDDRSSTMSNGRLEIIRSLGHVRLHVQNRFRALLSVCDNMSTSDRPTDPRDINALGFAAALAKEGTLELVKSQEETDSAKPFLTSGAIFDISIRAPQRISANGHGKVLVVNEDASSMSIWDAKSGAWEYEHEWDGTDTIKTFAWAVTPDGSALVALCFYYHIVVLAQIRYAYPGLERSWVDIRHIRMRDFTTQSVGDLCWLRSGDLVVGTGIQIFVFEGFAISDHNQDSRPLQDVQRRIPHNDSTFAVMAMLNSLLPLFHPTVLSLLTWLGGLKATKHIIYRLHRSLRFLAEGETLPSFLDLDLETVLVDDRKAQTKWYSLTDTNGDLNDDFEPQLAQISPSLNENLEKHDLWQLNKEEKSQLVKRVEECTELEKQEHSLDANGRRYLQALYACGDGECVAWKAIAFAARSTSQEVLAEAVTQHYGGKLTWEAARKSGLFSWLSDSEALRLQMENVARAEYTKQEEKNPVDCSLHYFALGKKTVVQGLWRMTIGVRERENTMKFLAHNFNEPRWKEAALKNAYALLSKRRFQYAAAFFLLAGSLWDAVNVCLNQLQDMQLAIAIARVYKSEMMQFSTTVSEDMVRLVHQAILPRAVQSEQGRWMASWAFCLLGRRKEAIRVLVHPVHQVLGVSLVKGAEDDAGTNGQPDGIVEGNGDMVGSLSYAANDPLLTILYLQLRAEFVKENKWHKSVISAREEWGFVMRCVRQYLRMGCDVLALSLVRDWEFVPESKDLDLDLGVDRARGSIGSPSPGIQRRKTFVDLEKEIEAGEEDGNGQALSREGDGGLLAKDQQLPEKGDDKKKKPPPTQFVEPSADSLLDSFGF